MCVCVCVCMILHAYVKQCKYKIIKKCDFYLRRGNFIMSLMISQLNGPLQKKKKTSKYTPTTNYLVWLCNKIRSLKYIIKLSIK
jgi:hypothetical protein